jgi:hypothetical protein
LPGPVHAALGISEGQNMSRELPRGLDPKRIEFWLTVNYFFACMVPLQVAARYAYVNFAVAHFGSFKPMSLTDWLLLSLGIMSLFTALSYSWRNIKTGTIFGIILCLNGMVFSASGAYSFVNRYHWHWSVPIILLGFLSVTWLYSYQLHFILTKYRKEIRNA